MTPCMARVDCDKVEGYGGGLQRTLYCDLVLLGTVATENTCVSAATTHKICPPQHNDIKC